MGVVVRCFIANAGQDAPPTMGCLSTLDKLRYYKLKCVTPNWFSLAAAIFYSFL